jgi:CheY-like chemotaxis protein
MRILIADDDRVFSLMVSRAFQRHGWDVIPAYDAMQAMMFAGRTPHPDAIVLDIGMPGGTGLGVLSRLKASSRTAMIPVFVVSGSIAADAEEEAKDAGAAAFVRKPVDPQDILRLVQTKLGPDSTSLADDHE